MRIVLESRTSRQNSCGMDQIDAMDLIGRDRSGRTWGGLLSRGVRKKCPHCGTGHLFRGWFRMIDRCRGCGLRFEREPGFFVGAYLINFAVTVILLFIGAMAFIAVKAIDHDASPRTILIISVVIALLFPPFFYPYSRTIWSAFDIGMTPLEDSELAEAAEALARGDVGELATSPRGGTGDRLGDGPRDVSELE